MSMVPFCSSGTRLADVTDWVFTCRSARPVAFFTSSTMRPQISQAKPVGFWPSARYEKGIDDSRYETVMKPAALTLSRVEVGCACAGPATSTHAMAAAAMAAKPCEDRPRGRRKPGDVVGVLDGMDMGRALSGGWGKRPS